MNLQAYIKGCNRGEFQWECIESGTYGEGDSVDVEEVNLKGRSGIVTRNGSNEYSAEIDNLKYEPFYDEKEFTSRKSAREWVERFINQDVLKDITVTEYQLDMMKHTLGLNYKKKPYRNRFFTSESDKDWNEIVGRGLAIKGSRHINNDENVYFWLSKQGVEFVTGKSISEKAYKEL